MLSFAPWLLRLPERFQGPQLLYYPLPLGNVVRLKGSYNSRENNLAEGSVISIKCKRGAIFFQGFHLTEHSQDGEIILFEGSNNQLVCIGHLNPSYFNLLELSLHLDKEGFIPKSSSGPNGAWAGEQELLTGSRQRGQGQVWAPLGEHRIDNGKV